MAVKRDPKRKASASAKSRHALSGLHSHPRGSSRPIERKRLGMPEGLGLWGVLAIVALVLILVILVWVNVGRPAGQESKLRGQWKFASAGESIFFDANSRFEVVRDGATPANSGTYVTDFSKDPAWIDIMPEKTSLFAGTAITRKAQGIIRFLGDDVMEIAFQGGGSGQQLGLQRPASFESASYTATLRRSGK